VRCAVRDYYYPFYLDWNFGFRVVAPPSHS